MANSLTIEKGARIGRMNLIHGKFDVILHKGAWLEFYNRLSGGNMIVGGKRSRFEMGEGSHVTGKHSFDLTGSIYLGRNTTIAGFSSYFWTHSFIRGHNGTNIARVDGQIKIGDGCYIASNNVICPGVNVSNGIMTGAGTVVSKSLLKKGLYVSSQMRYIDFDGERDISKYGKAIDNIEGLNVYKKQ